MPNWCENTLYLTHKDPKMVDKAIDGWKNNKFFATLYPEPDYTKVKVKHTFPKNMVTGEDKPEFVEPDQAWYDWRLQNWGTKWDVATHDHYLDVQENEHGKSIRTVFSTAWSPPTDLYNKLVDDGYEIKAMYHEGGCAFCGLYEDGSEDFYDITGDWKWVKENIPQDIDCEFSISQSMMEYRAEDLANYIEDIEEELKETDTQELRDQLAQYKTELEEIENA